MHNTYLISIKLKEQEFVKLSKRKLIEKYTRLFKNLDIQASNLALSIHYSNIYDDHFKEICTSIQITIFSNIEQKVIIKLLSNRNLDFDIYRMINVKNEEEELQFFKKYD